VRSPVAQQKQNDPRNHTKVHEGYFVFVRVISWIVNSSKTFAQETRTADLLQGALRTHRESGKSLLDAPFCLVDQEVVFLVTQFHSVVIRELRWILMLLINGVGLGAQVRQHMMPATGRTLVA